MKLNLIIYLIIFLLNTITIAQNNYIKDIKIHSINGQITVDLKLKDFFTDDILGAVNSGMNISFHFYFELYDSKKKILKEQESIINVRNDIWEHQYSINGYQISKKFKEFSDFKKFLLDSMQFGIKSTKKISDSNKLQLYITFSPQRVSSSQKKKIRNWLRNEDEDSESSLSLNITKIISFFLSNDEIENISIYKSTIFTKKSVTVNGRSSQ